MNDLEELLYNIKLCGVEYQQAEDIIIIVQNWINQEYPVMGALSELWLKENGFEKISVQEG